MKAVVQRVIGAAAVRAAVEEVDISADPDLEARYGLEIPVLLVDGKKTAKYRVTEDELTRILLDRAG
jgi:fructose-specific component phosphotransferase system IIB-like protein